MTIKILHLCHFVLLLMHIAYTIKNYHRRCANFIFISNLPKTFDGSWVPFHFLSKNNNKVQLLLSDKLFCFYLKPIYWTYFTHSSQPNWNFKTCKYNTCVLMELVYGLELLLFLAIINIYESKIRNKIVFAAAGAILC